MGRFYLKEIMTWQNSNLTFGAGGKGKDGAEEAGWGYYEVR